MRETSKEIDVGGDRYRLGKMSALVASRIFNLLMSSVMKAKRGEAPEEAEEPEAQDSEERANGTVAFMWMLAAGTLDQDVYAKIQSQCLATVARLDGEAIIPIRMADGRWAVKELEQDAPAVNQLVREALQFNVAPFFLAGLLKAAPAPATER